MRLGDTFFDPYVAILDAKRFELATGDDSPLRGAGRRLLDRGPGRRQVHRPGPRERLRRQRRVPVPAARRHLPAADGGRARGRQAGRGTRGHVPRRPGRADQAEGQAARRRRPRHWRLHCQTPEGISPTGFKFRVADLPQRGRERSRTTPSPTATPGAAPGAFNGVVEKPGEVDLLQVRGEEGAGVRRPLLRPAARLAARPGAVRRQRSAAAAIAGNDDSGGPDSYFRFTVPEDGEYVVCGHATT